MRLEKFLFFLTLVAGSKLRYGSGPFHEDCQAGAYPAKRVLYQPQIHQINLNLAPEQRWTKLAKLYGKELRNSVDVILDLANKVDDKIVPFLIEHLEVFAKTLPENYRLEMESLADGAGLDFGDIVLFNVFYEAFSACTSIIAKDANGGVIHARNMDFGLFLGIDFHNMTWALTEALRPSVIEMEFVKDGQVQFTSIGFIGYVGIFTAVKKNEYSLTVNERFNLNGGWVGILEWLLGNHDAKWLGFFTRDVLEQCDDFNCANELLIKTKMVSPVYFILADGRHQTGSIIVRDREKTAEVVTIDQESDPSKSGSWFVLQTNYDPWTEPPFFDDRRHPGIKCMNELATQTTATKEMLFDVLSTKPNLNMLTVYTSLIDIPSGKIESYIRECPFPCTPW